MADGRSQADRQYRYTPVQAADVERAREPENPIHSIATL
jgi:hypothetical protein